MTKTISKAELLSWAENKLMCWWNDDEDDDNDGKDLIKNIVKKAFKAGQAQALDWVKKEASKNACDYELDHKKNKIYYISIEMLKELINQRKNAKT